MYSEILLIVALLPAIVLGIYIYKKDKIEREPTSLLVKLFVGGILAIIITLLVTIFVSIFYPNILGDTYSGYLELIIQCFIFVGLIEEGSKWFMLKSMTWKDKNFDHIFDAIVYASFVSLGFATLENVLYVFENGIVTGLFRALLSVPGHLFFGIFMGYFYGIAKEAWHYNKQEIYKRNLVLSIIIPTILHGFFDFCLFSESIVLLIIYLLFMIFLYIKSFTLIRRISNNDKPFIKSLYCPYCGSRQDGKYCSVCGNKLV